MNKKEVFCSRCIYCREHITECLLVLPSKYYCSFFSEREEKKTFFEKVLKIKKGVV